MSDLEDILASVSCVLICIHNDANRNMTRRTIKMFHLFKIIIFFIYNSPLSYMSLLTSQKYSVDNIVFLMLKL